MATGTVSHGNHGLNGNHGWNQDGGIQDGGIHKMAETKMADRKNLILFPNFFIKANFEIL